MSFNKKIKIGIYSGEIPSSKFIENLIVGLSRYFPVYVYGTLNENISYKSEHIKVYSISKSKVKRISVLLYRLIMLSIFDINTFYKLIKKIKLFSTPRTDFKYLEKIVPIMLYRTDILHFQWATSLKYFDDVLDELTTIVSLRGSLINIKPFINSQISDEYINTFKKVNFFHAVSEDIKEVAKQFISTDKTIRVIKPAVNESLMGLNKNKVDFSKIKKLKIISVGGNKWVKGFTYSIDAMKILKDMDMNFEYTLIAPGEDNQKLKYQIDNLELENHIKYIPGLNHDDVIKELSQNHIYLLSSVSEGIANVVIESMAIGTLVISTNCGGMHEVISDGNNGFLVPIRSPKLMAEKIIMVSKSNNKKIRKIISNAKNTIKSNHLLCDQIDEMRDFYSKVLDT